MSAPHAEVFVSFYVGTFNQLLSELRALVKCDECDVLTQLTAMKLEDR